MQVAIEVILFRLVKKRLRWRKVEGSISKHETPDAAALRLGFQGSDQVLGDFKGVCHSTSWRFDDRSGDNPVGKGKGKGKDKGKGKGKGKRIILTYAILPDPSRSFETFNLDASVVESMDPLRPAPSNLRPENVAAHAVMHVAELSHRNPLIAAQSRLYPELYKAVREFDRGGTNKIITNRMMLSTRKRVIKRNNSIKQSIHSYISNKGDVCCETDFDRDKLITQIEEKYKEIAKVLGGPYLDYLHNDIPILIGYFIDLTEANDSDGMQLWQELDKLTSNADKKKAPNAGKIRALLREVPLYYLLSLLGMVSYKAAMGNPQ
jgi:hypothetical protein